MCCCEFKDGECVPVDGDGRCKRCGKKLSLAPTYEVEMFRAGMLVVRVAIPPNKFHRFMSWLLLGWKWRKLR